MELFAASLTRYQRLATLEVKVGDLSLGNFNPIRIQTMTTTDTLDTEATVAQAIRCIEAGAELVRITAPSRKEAENLLPIKNALRKKGYHTPLVADIHFTPNAAEIAARIVEKVRINPGNYIDKKKFETIEYTDQAYQEEIERIRDRFTPLVRICKSYGTAMRIGTNHGSLSDRIMSRYGDTPIGMVESAMEFLRIAESEQYYNIVLSMKSSNPRVMVEAYRLLIENMDAELGHCYPLHLGVTEAGDGEDGRIKSSIGIGTLLEDGIGDTIRVSLTEDPEFEIPVCRDLVKRYQTIHNGPVPPMNSGSLALLSGGAPKPATREIKNLGGKQVPVVVADLSKPGACSLSTLSAVGYHYEPSTVKWNIGDMAPDYIYAGSQWVAIPLPGTLSVIYDYPTWLEAPDKQGAYPLFETAAYLDQEITDKPSPHFVRLDCYSRESSKESLEPLLDKFSKDPGAVICLQSTNDNAMQSIRRMLLELAAASVHNPVLFFCESHKSGMEESLIHYAVETGALFIEGFGNGICLRYFSEEDARTPDYHLVNSIAFGILQATRTRISKTEYISCPSCGRTLFDLQETTSKIRAVTHHLKGVKIAIMGCIVNGPGEMADADFGYVGSGPGKITLYKGKEIIKRGVPESIAVTELIELLKANGAWVEPPVGVTAG